MLDKDKQTEERIFDAATDVFEEKGMDGTRMQDIANRAGINKALLHYYFRTKELLFDAVFRKLSGRLFEKFAPVFSENMSLEEKIRFFFREHITFLHKNPRLPAFLINEINRNPGAIKMILKNVDFNKFWTMLESQHMAELRQYGITKDDLPQLMTTIASISVFPFAARGLFEGILESQGKGFDGYIEERKDFAADFVIAAIKNWKNKSR